MKESLPSRDSNCESFHAAPKRARDLFFFNIIRKSKYHKNAPSYLRALIWTHIVFTRRCVIHMKAVYERNITFSECAYKFILYYGNPGAEHLQDIFQLH